MFSFKHHPALQALSFDHNLFLTHVRSIQWLIEGHPSAQPIEAVIRALLQFWERDGLDHLREEEEIFLPLYAQRDLEGGKNIERVIADHTWLRTHIMELYQRLWDRLDNKKFLAQIGERIYSHVQFEEQTLFPRAEAVLSAEDLTGVGAQSQAFRELWRPHTLGK